MFLMVLFSTIIYICIILYYRIYHKFWFNQPVDFIFTLETVPGKIKSLDYVHKYNKNFMCSLWKDKEDILNFLNENFNPEGELYNYADYTFNSQSIVFQIQNNNSKEVCGCISVRPIKLTINDEQKVIFYVDHLNVKEDYRGQGLATDLISYIIDTLGDQTYLFKKDIHPLPFKYFCKYKYYLVLDQEKGNILPEVSEYFEKIKNYKIYSPPDNTSIILKKDNYQAIIYYTNIMDKEDNPIYEIGYAENEYIAQLAINYIKYNFPESSIIVNSLSETDKYYKKKFLSENYLYFFNYRLPVIYPRDIFLVYP